MIDTMKGRSNFLLLIFASLTLLMGVSQSKRQLLVGFWGQNIAGSILSPSDTARDKLGAYQEKPLKEVCETTEYDILSVSFLDIFWNHAKDGGDTLPSLSLSQHCGDQSSENSLPRCPKIEEGIKECQNAKKKVILTVGGPTADGTLPSPAKAREFAHTLFNLFLGGSSSGYEKIRPFGKAIMDGINLDIEGGRPDYYPDLIQELRTLMDADTTKSYIITASPQCAYPDHFLGPDAKGTGLEEAGQHVDHVYVQFYNDRCYVGTEDFTQSLNDWLGFAQRKRRPLIFVGVPAHPSASSDTKYYNNPRNLRRIYEAVRSKPGIGGIMLWDVSWDQVNIIEGKRFSEYISVLVKDAAIVKPTESQPTKVTSQELLQEFTCDGKSDGLYPNTSDCTKYYQCNSGNKEEHTCPPGLAFNKALKTCDWSQNVQC